MKRFFQLIGREFRLFYANKVMVALFIGAPILYTVLIGNVYKKGGVTNLPVVVVDEDRSVMSQKLIQMLQDNEVVEVRAVLGDNLQSRELALKYEAPCVIQIPRGFESDISLKRYPEMVVFVDASNVLTANFATGAVNVVAGTMKAGIEMEALKKQGVPASIAATQYEPFRTTFVKENIRTNNYLYFMLPGVLLTVLQQVLLLALALTFSSEFEQGTFKDLVQKMPNVWGVLLVKMIPYILMTGGIFMLYYFSAGIYRMPLRAPLWPFIGATTLFVLAVCALGVFISIIIPSQLKATEILMVVATPSFILSGFTWPLSQMPVWVQHIANMIPLTHYLKIFRNLFITHGDVSLNKQPLMALVLIFVVCLLLAVISLYWKMRTTKKEMLLVENK